MKKKIIFNVIVIILLLCATEFSIYNIYKYKQMRKVQKTDFGFHKDCKYKLGYTTFTEINSSEEHLRPVADFGKNHKILLFGCSYAYGASLEKEQTLYYKLAQKTKSTIYNRAFMGLTNTYMLYQAQNPGKSFDINKIDKDIDIIIYLYIENHKDRLFRFYWSDYFSNIYNLRYKKIKTKNGEKIVENKPILPFIHIFFIAKAIHQLTEIAGKNKEKEMNFLIDVFRESHDELKKLYPNARFIILQYLTDELKSRKSELENAGWELYSTFDLTDGIDLNDEKYHFKNDPHPTEPAWDIISDKLIEKNIIN